MDDAPGNEPPTDLSNARIRRLEEKIKTIEGQQSAAPSVSPISPALVSQLELILASAKRGEISEFVTVTLSPNGNVNVAWACLSDNFGKHRIAHLLRVGEQMILNQLISR